MVYTRNHVVIQPDPHETEMASNGLKTAHWVNKQHEFTVTGTVIVPPTVLYFDKQPRIPRLSSRKMVRDFSNIRRRSLDFKPTKRLKEGDKILYSYSMHLDLEEYDKYKGNLILPYDLIYGVIEENTIEPINGYVFVERFNYDYSDLKMIRQNNVKLGEGLVKYVGKPTRYLDYPDDTTEVSEGDYIHFDARFAAKIEWSLYNKLNPEGNPLVKIQRKDIFVKKHGKKIN